jgi:nucleotide-binding universal stress UspA family protein
LADYLLLPFHDPRNNADEGPFCAEEIVKEAAKLKADLIVVGSRGRSVLAAAVLDSVAYGVIHKDTKTPVLVVKR